MKPVTKRMIFFMIMYISIGCIVDYFLIINNWFIKSVSVALVSIFIANSIFPDKE